ncbi:hypothetical protein MKK88_21185 [Methylobacterium sp. E-005]|uniref:hypothetical protein n=1 Tax=Methylobacterium sp. E-005 TaxID=2836549 RepID=UPI001FB8A12F|nr:hypothetical protein [Methylobacterium sp. E-005]MCJ2088475.1 hypothetical protein [Methylobacterium sp. E-005]
MSKAVSEMVERIARALHDLAYGTEEGWEDWIPEAKTALDAMREPTAEMIAAYLPGSYRKEQEGIVCAIYTTMIDAALSPVAEEA